MKNLLQVMQIAFTYIGTVVGAGFATGQEILQFFTRFGASALWIIIIAALMFIWLGTKIMLLSHDIGAHSYEDLNRYLFGDKTGRIISFIMMGLLFCISSVMLAGSGSIFQEHLNLPYQAGLLFTMILSYIVITKGVQGILAVNSVIVPLVLMFTLIIVWNALNSAHADFWITRTNEYDWKPYLLSPFLYIGLNLTLAQAVLVPVGSAIKDRKIVYWGGILGGTGIGVMLLAGHIALSSGMPGIVQFEIPMGAIVTALGGIVTLLFLTMIYAEIFTTLIADVYGLTLQIEQKIYIPRNMIVMSILVLCFGISQIGFSTLLSTLYPLFGMLSLGWLVVLIKHRNPSHI